MKLRFIKIRITGLAIAGLLVCSGMTANAQDSIRINGVIKSLEKTPVSGVSISIEGSADLPVLSDENGEFTIKIPGEQVWLMLSSTEGFKDKRIYVNGRRSLDIALTSLEMASGDDLLTLMNQDLYRNELVGSVNLIDIENMEHTPAITFDEYLQGRVPGLNVTYRSGAPGSGSVLSLRGINSLNASNQPLIVVDGIPIASQGLFESNLGGYSYNPLSSVNQFDISKLTIVKDPALSTSYGSKGSNGVILVETLDPSATQTSIEIDYRNGFSLMPDTHIPVMNANQHKTLISELLFSSDFLEEEIVEEFPNLFLEQDDDRYRDYQHDTPWQDYIFDNALYTNFNLNVKGGDGIARYGLSFGFMDGQGVIKNTGMQGYNLRFVSMLNIFTWLKMDAGVSLNYSFADMKEAATVKQTSPILASTSKSPLLNPYKYDLEGNELSSLTEVDELGVSNPVGTIENFSASNSNYNFTTTLGLTADLAKNLQLRSDFSLNYNALKEAVFMPNKGMELYFNDEAINVAKLSNNSLNSFYNGSYLKYSNTFGSHKISSNTGMNLQINQFQFDWGLTKNAHENDEYRMIQDGQNNLREIGGRNADWNWMSFYEYINYSFQNKYLASVAISLDGSSMVGDNAANTINLGAPFGLFYSGGLAWRVSSESFLKNASWLEDLKIRLSYGKSGNDDIGEASATNYYRSIKFRETVGLYPGSVANDELSYETVNQMNAGIDFATKGNRFILNLDVYKNTTNDMLIFSPISSYLGYSLRMENNGSMENTGLDAGLFYRIIDKGSFKWDITASLSSLANKVTAIKGEALSYEILGGERVNMVNETANSFYGYLVNEEGGSVYSTQAEADAAGLVNDKGLAYQAGDVIYQDLSGPDGSPDSVINFYDKTVIGSSLPDYFGGMSTTVTYKRFALNVAIQFSYGNDIFNYVRFINERMSTLDNQSSAVLNRWQYDGQITDVPRAQFDDPMGNSDFSSRWIEDGSYARLKHVSLSYTIPDEFLTFRNAEIYISVNNLLTLSRYLGYYPEFSYSYSQTQMGIDYGLTPQTMQFVAGIKLGL